MTYCVAAKLSTGLVLLSDSRTNAGVDDISITKKMSIYKKRMIGRYLFFVLGI